MRQLFQVIRRNQFINAIVRKLLLEVRSLVEKAISYWHISGSFSYELEGKSIKLYAEADDALTSKLYYNKKWENHILQWFIFFSRSSQSIVDAGANIGLFSLFSAKVNPSAEIHAFEPNPNNSKRLHANIGLNDARNCITVQPYALADSDSSVLLHMPVGKGISDVSSVYPGHSRSFNHFEHVSISVRSVSLDSFFKDRKRKIDLLKIDVELYEFYVLLGMRKILMIDRPIVFCEIFNDKIKRKQNKLIDDELPVGITIQISDFLQSVNYHFYSVTSDGLVGVPDFSWSPMSTMYLLLPKKLESDHYLFIERETVKSQL